VIWGGVCEESLSVLAGYIGPHKIMWATDYPHSDGFFPWAPQMISERLEPLPPEARHQCWPVARWDSSSRPVFPHQRSPVGFIEPLS
jgi:hypothetical protein